MFIQRNPEGCQCRTNYARYPKVHPNLPMKIEAFSVKIGQMINRKSALRLKHTFIREKTLSKRSNI